MVWERVEISGEIWGNVVYLNLRFLGCFFTRENETFRETFTDYQTVRCDYCRLPPIYWLVLFESNPAPLKLPNFSTIEILKF